MIEVSSLRPKNVGFSSMSSLAEISIKQWDFLIPGKSIFDFDEIEAFPYFIFYLWAVWSVLWFAGLILLFFRRNETNVHMRSPTLVILSSFGAEMAFSCTAWDIAITRARFPCFLDLWYILMFLPLYFVPFVLRFIKYFFTMFLLDRWQRGKISDFKDSILVQESTYVIFLGIIMSACMIFASTFQFTIVSEWVNCYGCEMRNLTFIFIVVLLSLCFIGIVAGLVLMRRIPDPYGIKKELVSCFIVWLISLIPYVIIYRFAPQYSDYLGYLMFIFIAAGYFSSVLWPIVMSFKRPPEDMAPKKLLVTLDQIVSDEEGFVIVKKYLLLRSNTEYSYFIPEFFKYREIRDPIQLKEKAMSLYKRFIKEGAEYQINVSKSMAAYVEQRLENPSNDLFNLIYREIIKLVQTNDFSKIKNDPDYIALVQRREAEEKMKQEEKRIIEGSPV